jgi:hypothetical protein
MSINALLAGLAIIGLGLIGAGGCAAPKGVMEGKQHQSSARVRCHATGAKLIAPAMTAEAICARFSAAIELAIAAGETLSVDLKFLPNGVVTAIVTRVRAGKTSAPVDFNLAVSDRGFGLRDLDRLAADVAAGLRKTT